MRGTAAAASPGDRERVTGLVLAGGRGSRMGGTDKGLLDFGGQPVAQHVLRRLQPQVDASIISANRHLDRYRAMGVPVVEDAASGEPGFDGPLAGVLAGLRICQTPWLACVPCDAPWFPTDLVDRLMHAATSGGRRASVAVRGEARGASVEPAFCLLHRDQAGALARALDDGTRKWQVWLDAIGAAHAVFSAATTQSPPRLDADPFANLNTPADWAQARPPNASDSGGPALLGRNRS